MRLTYCFAICLIYIIAYANANEGLPKFVVKVQTDNAISIKDVDEMHVLVKASNMDGMPLEGKLSLRLYFSLDYLLHPNFTDLVLKNTKTADIFNGQAKFDFNITEWDLQFAYGYSKQLIKLFAKLEEKLSGAIITGTGTTTIYANRYNMNHCLNYYSCIYYEVDKEFDVIHQITYINGSYIKDTTSLVELTYNEILYKFENWQQSAEAETVAEANPPISRSLSLTQTGRMNETGFVIFKVLLPDLPEYEGYLHFYEKTLKYLDEKITYSRLYKKV